MENPLFGVGIDSFGDFYRTNRTLQIAQITSVDLTVDNAHNSVIQIFATLGIVGLIAYFLVFIPALLKLFGYLWKVQLSKTEWAIASLFISTFSISLISIDNIGVAIINWSLAGICVGVFFTKRGLSSPNEIRHSSPKRIIINSSSLEVLRPSIVGLLSLSFFVFGWLASSPDRELINIFRTPADTNIQGSIDKRWGALFGLGKSNGSLQEAQYRFVIQGIDETNTWPIALQAAEIGIKKYPRDFTLLDRAAVVAEKMGKFTEAKDLRQRQLEIDPRHPLVRLYLARSLVELGETSRATIEVKKAREFESLLSTEGLNYLKSLEQKIQEVQNG
jgi:hypothetical protein